MAESLAHRWGQIIGDGFEMFVRDILADVAKRHGLYLDFKRPRKVRKDQGKVTWQDGYGNKHDLDYVLEQGERKTRLAFRWRSSNRLGGVTPNTRRTRRRRLKPP